MSSVDILSIFLRWKWSLLITWLSVIHCQSHGALFSVCRPIGGYVAPLIWNMYVSEPKIDLMPFYWSRASGLQVCLDLEAHSCTAEN